MSKQPHLAVLVLGVIVCFASAGFAQPLGAKGPPSAAKMMAPGGSDVIVELGEKAPGQSTLPVPSGQNTKKLKMIVPGGPATGVDVFGQYSPTLQAYFAIRWFQLGPYVFPGAKLLSYPDPGSPLRPLGLRPGDIITRLDGVRVYNYDELDRHFAETTVRYVRYPGTVRSGTIYIDADLITP